MEYALTPEIRVAASPELMQRGCVYIIGLEKIKNSVGTKWDKTKNGVWSHLENMLRQRLSPTDFFAQIDDTSALVSMPSLKAEEAQISCFRIAQELHSVMLGPCDPAEISILRALPLPDGSMGTLHIGAAEQAVSKAPLPPAAANGILYAPGKRGFEQMLPKVGFTHQFVPVWNCQKEAITTYRCTSRTDTEVGDTMARNARFKLELSITISRIRHAARILAERIAASDRFLMWIPISYDVMSAPVGRMEIAALCRELSGELRPYLILEICDLPYGVPQSRLSELIGSLRPFCRSVMAQLPPRIANYGAYFSVGLHAIGLSLSGPSALGTDMLSEIFKLSFAARKQNILSFVFDVPNEETLRTARETGINLLSGPLFGPALDMPEPIRRLTAAQLHKDFALGVPA